MFDDIFIELRELQEYNDELIKIKFKQFDEKLVKIKQIIERTEKKIKNFGELN